MVIESLNVQSGNDPSGVFTDMLTLNSTVRILYRNPATFFTVHVTSTPLQLSYSQLILASGQVNNSTTYWLNRGCYDSCKINILDFCLRKQIEKFSQQRKSERIIKTEVFGNQIPLYGGVPALYVQRDKPDQVVLPFNLTFTLRSRAYVFGPFVKTSSTRASDVASLSMAINLARHLISPSLVLINDFVKMKISCYYILTITSHSIISLFFFREKINLVS